MSHDKSWKLRTVLTLGATAFVLCMSTGSGFAAGREGHLGGMAMMRGGAAEMRSTAQPFANVRVTHVFPGPTPSFNAPEATARTPMTHGHRPYEPPVPGQGQTADSVGGGQPSADVQSPVAAGRSVVQDPIVPSTSVQTPTAAGSSVVQDPVAPSASVQRSSTPATSRSVVQDPIVPSASAQSPMAVGRSVVQDPVVPSTSVQRSDSPATDRSVVQDPIVPSASTQHPVRASKPPATAVQPAGS